MSLTAYAATDTYTTLKNNVTIVHFNDYDWYIIEDNSTSATEGTVTLLAKDPIGKSEFHSTSNAYSGSEVKTYLDNLTGTGGSFASVADAIETVKVKGSDSDNEVDAKLWLLSTTEVNSTYNLPTEVKKCSTSNVSYWWLRSPGTYVDPDNGTLSAACVYGGDGNVDDAGFAVWQAFGVRPALKLDLSKVTFDSGTNTFSVAPSHEHAFTYSENGATITATCDSLDGECTLTDNTATLTIAPSSTGGYGASLSGDAAEFGVTDTDIEYSSDNGSTWSNTVPSTAGSYQARIKVKDAADNTKTYTASVSYGVNKIATDKTYTESDHGTVTVPEAAAANTTVTIKTTPATAFQLESLTVTKAGGGTVSVTKDGNNGTFTMPAENVTVSATFVGKDITVNLKNVTDGGSTCTASLLDGDYKKVDSLTAKAGGKFILSINKDEDYFYNVSLGSDTAVSMEEFSVDDYKAYIQNAESKNVSVSLDTYLFWVTMPGVDSDSVDMTVNFGKAKTFTILYRPTGNSNPGEVWVKFGKTENNEDKLVTAKMSKDAAMGDVAVWSLKMSAAFNPDKIAFATSESAAKSANTETATVSDATFDWNTITGTNDKYLIVGNNAKTVIAAFTDDSDSSDVDREATVIRIGDDAEYQIAICGTDGNGTVTTPDAPTKAGYEFVAWRGYEGITAKDYAANTQISVKENMVFSAVWKPSTPNVKLNLNGGTGIDNTEFTVTYNTTLASLTPVKSGFSFVGWSVAKDVTEDGKVYTKGAPFDTGTKITADLELTAQWKHVHAYGYVQIGAVSSLATKYEKYAPYLHIKICGCGDVDLEAHSLDSSGRCVCGYSKPAAPSTAELNVSYGQWLNGNYTEKMAELPETVAADSEVSVSAPGKWGSLTFSKWQYSTDNGSTWEDAGAYKMMSFVIPCNMKMRALYVNATTKPEVSMSATTYATKASDGNLYNSILFRMNYKLPDGYTYVDSGVRSGDNAGISYYELKERRYSMDAEVKAVAYSITAVTSLFSGGPETYDTSGTEQYYAKRENSVLDEAGMNATTLGEYMYQSKPINIKDAPLYWNYKPNTTGQSGSINALTPVGFAQRNNGDHYIYAIAWLQYKKPDGKVETIWTDAMATTLNGVPSSGSVSKTGE